MFEAMIFLMLAYLVADSFRDSFRGNLFKSQRIGCKWIWADDDTGEIPLSFHCHLTEGRCQLKTCPIIKEKE